MGDHDEDTSTNGTVEGTWLYRSLNVPLCLLLEVNVKKNTTTGFEYSVG